eukprot:scaffold3343_cov309-Prasinococcus_capsulatus_cf.AAC.3
MAEGSAIAQIARSGSGYTSSCGWAASPPRRRHAERGPWRSDGGPQEGMGESAGHRGRRNV